MQPEELEGVHTHTFKLKPFKKAKSCDICKQAITKEGLICKGEEGGGVDGGMDGGMDGPRVQGMDGRKDGWVNGWRCGGVGGWINGWMVAHSNSIPL